MNSTLAAVLQVVLLVAALAACHRPLGEHMARVYTSPRHLRVERLLYRGIGANPDAQQRWSRYLASVLGFSLASLLALYGLQRLQNQLPFSLGFRPISPDQAFNTAASFVTNTNWQSYSGEQAMGHLVQMVGLTVQNFVSAAVGMAVAMALVRGFARSRTGEIGNFWVDLVRGCLRVLLPIAVIGAIVLVAAGSIQNLASPHAVQTLSGGVQHITGGPVASQEVIKNLGTNGGGFYNANAAHPFENPTSFTNLFEIFLMLLIPVCLTRTFGRIVGDPRQGYAILAAMTVLWLASVIAMSAIEAAHPGAAPGLAGAAMEGKEQRFGVAGSSLFAVSTTMTSTGAVNSFHDSFTALGGGLTMFDMMLGEVSPGGVGSGLYGMLILAVIAVFVAGLMVGRTPEYLGKKIGPRQMKLASLYILLTPSIVLVGAGLAIALPGERASMLNNGAHGFGEILYAFTSGANNNGSAFGGLSANTVWYNTAIGLAMLAGRFLPMVFVLALAGSLARARPTPPSAGALPTHRPLFVTMLVSVVLLVAGLTFFPALALGPLAEGLR